MPKTSRYVSTDTQSQNEFGAYVPAIPEPFYRRKLFGTWHVTCDCGRAIRGEQRYREHFAYAHILGMEAN